MLAELDHVLKKTYVTRTQVEQFLRSLSTAKKLAGGDPCDFWKTVNFLNIQGGGNSQREMLAMFDTVLQSTCGLSLDDCGSDDGPYVYLDDAIFTGNRIRIDLMNWIQSSAPTITKVHVVVIGIHRGGQWYAETEISKAANTAAKRIEIKWWRCLSIEDRRSYTTGSDVLRPSALPTDTKVQQYIEEELAEFPPNLRPGNSVGGNRFFSSSAGRNLLEQEFLKAGCKIRNMCTNLNQYQRPLGYMRLHTLGFGSMIVTFRNCANNCPLAFWVDSPWYPLFPRKSN